MKSQLLLTIILLIIPLSTPAQITTDGSLGSRANLPGPDYQIKADLGQQHGGNLFHSFQDFNLQSFESATFSGPNSVSNVISRVTGGNPSNIDGLIRSTMPNADMYFLNPYGMMFGPHARLDVQGSFHASTADYLRLGENGRFNARNPSDSLLTVAPVDAFGFLTNSPASLSVEGSQLEIDYGKTFSLISGELSIKNAQIQAPAGRINLASLAEMGNVIPTFDDFIVPSLRADITISEESLINVSGEGGGTLFIRSGQFFADNSMIKADTLGSQAGYGIHIEVGNMALNQSEMISDTLGEGHAGPISIEADNIALNDESWIISNTVGEGNAGPISIETNNIALNDSIITSDTQGNGEANQVSIIAKDKITMERSTMASGAIGSADNIGNADQVVIRANELVMIGGGIFSETYGKGNAGQIFIEVNNLLIENGGRLYTSTTGIGDAGHIHINATGTVTVSGVQSNGFASRIESASRPFVDAGGQGGNILIESKALIVKDGGHISVSSIAKKNSQSGAGGNITLHVKEDITLSGVNPYGENEEGFGAGIYARNIGEKAGVGGQIELSAGSLTIQKGAVIESSTNNTAPGGHIKIDVTGPVHISGDASQIELLAPATSQKAYLQNFAPHTYNESTSGISASSNSSSEQGGLGGNITLTAQNLIITDKGRLSTTTAGGGQAGTITITVEQLQLDNTAKIVSDSQLANTFEDQDQLVASGDIVEIANEGDGKVGTRLSLNNHLIVIGPSIDSVAHRVELDQVSHQYNLVEGQVVEVKDIGNGQSARFIYIKQPIYDANLKQSVEIDKWFQIEEQNTVTLANQEALSEINNNWYIEPESPPYSAGTLIKVNDYEEGKPATFVYMTFSIFSMNDTIIGQTLGQTIRVIEPLRITHVVELKEVSDKISLAEGTRASVLDSGGGADFIYYNKAWIKLGATHKVANVTTLNHLQFAQAGNVTQVVRNGQRQRLIYSGQDWLPLSDEARTVESLAELNQLSAKTGDLVAVVDVNTGHYDHFFYADGKWIKKIRGGDAGQIVINADQIQLTQGSEISTGSISGGGGSVTLNVDKQVLLTDSQISTSVQESVGNGGDLSISEPQFVIMNNGQIIAQAYEGRGGNIHMGSKQLVKSPCSQISASSQLGIDGNVQIDSPDVDMDAFMVILPGGYVEAQLNKPCTQEEIENPSTFKIDLNRNRSLPFRTFKQGPP